MTSLRRRLLIGLVALVVAVLTLAGIETYRRTLESTGALLDYNLRQMAFSLRDQDRVTLPAEAVQDFDFVIQIWGINGVTIYSSRHDIPLVNRAKLGYDDVKVGDAEWRAFTLQMPDRVIQVSQPWRVRRRLAGAAAVEIIAPLLVLAPLLAVAIWWMVSRSLAPIQQLVAEVKKRDAESLEPVSARNLPDEVAPLVSELNRLLTRLGAALQAQRSFIADAAHELRSPLTALKVHLQLLERQAQTEPDRANAFEGLRDGIARAANLVEQLLTLARNEPGAQAPPFENVALETVVRDGVADAAALALARNSELSFEAERAGAIQGDPAALRVLVRNLVDNALRHSPQGARIRVRLTGERLDVEDSGPGIPAGEQERVFDRFYRPSGNLEDGSGLGLAIVKAIAERHRARVELGDSELGGLKVSVQFRSDDRDVPSRS